MRGNKGITLIALAITIIVLLILAGIALATLTGEKNAVTQANYAKAQTDRAKTQEQIHLTVIKVIDKDGTINVSELKKELEKIGVSTGEEPDLPLIVTKGEHTFVIDKDGNVRYEKGKPQ